MCNFLPIIVVIFIGRNKETLTLKCKWRPLMPQMTMHSIKNSSKQEKTSYTKAPKKNCSGRIQPLSRLRALAGGNPSGVHQNSNPRTVRYSRPEIGNPAMTCTCSSSNRLRISPLIFNVPPHKDCLLTRLRWFK